MIRIMFRALNELKSEIVVDKTFGDNFNSKLRIAFPEGKTVLQNKEMHL